MTKEEVIFWATHMVCTEEVADDTSNMLIDLVYQRDELASMLRDCAKLLGKDMLPADVMLMRKDIDSMICGMQKSFMGEENV